MGARRGEAVVCIAAGGHHEDFVESPAQRPAPLGRRRVTVLATAPAPAPPNGPVLEHERVADRVASSRPAGRTTLADAAAAAAPADVVALSAGCVVAAGWLERLARPLRRHRGQSRRRPPYGGAVARRAAADQPAEWLDVASGARRCGRGRQPPAAAWRRGGCVYLRRGALDLAGADDLSSLDGFGARCLAHRACATCWPTTSSCSIVGPAVDRPARPTRTAGPLAPVAGAARRALHGLSVLIDARMLDGPCDGTGCTSPS